MKQDITHFRHCERKRSNPAPAKSWIAASLTLLAMTAGFVKLGVLGVLGGEK